MYENGKQGWAAYTQKDPHLPAPQIVKPIISSRPESPIPYRDAFAAVKHQDGMSRSRGNVTLLHALKSSAALSPVLSAPIQAICGWDGTHCFQWTHQTSPPPNIHRLLCCSFPLPCLALHTPDCNNSRDTIWGQLITCLLLLCLFHCKYKLLLPAQACALSPVLVSLRSPKLKTA